jgi:hypothetical protein
MASSGAVNRLGTAAPANPKAVKARTPAAPTATGHQTGPPHVASRAVRANRTAHATA